jgi:hypothetical protein
MATAQVAIIKDKDGYVNVRKEPNGTSQIIHKILNNEVFWYQYEEGMEIKGEWIAVYIPKNDLSLASTQPEYIQGYIHRSRLLHLDKLEPYQGKEFHFEYVVKPFFTGNRIVDKRDGRWVVAIDGRPVWGTDGDFPRTQVESISVSLDGKKIPVSRVLYSDIYECTNEFQVFMNGDTYFVYQANSDGAGSYQIVWAFTKDGLKQRLVGSMI